MLNKLLHYISIPNKSWISLKLNQNGDKRIYKCFLTSIVLQEYALNINLKRTHNLLNCPSCQNTVKEYSKSPLLIARDITVSSFGLFLSILTHIQNKMILDIKQFRKTAYTKVLKPVLMEGHMTKDQESHKNFKLRSSLQEIL